MLNETQIRVAKMYASRLHLELDEVLAAFERQDKKLLAEWRELCCQKEFGGTE